LPGLAQKLARAIDARLHRGVACELTAVLQSAGRGGDEPAASRGHEGLAWHPCAASLHPGRRRTPLSPSALGPAPARVIGRWRPLLSWERTSVRVTVCGPAPAPAPHRRLPWAAPGWCRAVGGDRDGARAQSTLALCHRQADGGRPARRVWCRHVAAPAAGKDDSTRGQRRTARSLTHRGTNWHHPLFGSVRLLPTGVLIRVRPPPIGLRPFWGVTGLHSGKRSPGTFPLHRVAALVRA
jgi:hypothetical protein